MSDHHRSVSKLTGKAGRIDAAASSPRKPAMQQSASTASGLSDVEELAAALQRVMRQNPIGGTEIASMLRGLADEVGGKLEGPKRIFDRSLVAEPLFASPLSFTNSQIQSQNLSSLPHAAGDSTAQPVVQGRQDIDPEASKDVNVGKVRHDCIRQTLACTVLKASQYPDAVCAKLLGRPMPFKPINHSDFFLT